MWGATTEGKEEGTRGGGQKKLMVAYDKETGIKNLEIRFT